MDLPLQGVALLVLVALAPLAVYAIVIGDVLVAVAAINVLLIWLALRVATGGSVGLPGRSSGS